MSDFEQIKNKLRDFASDRDWDQFHSPKNLVMALSVEVAELVEPFQWMSEEGSKNLSNDTLDEVADEIADVQLYLIRLADKLGVDILKAVDNKIEKNDTKYPADKVRGSSKKYTEYKDGDINN
ncbi:nucleotide pyrophosphohydrolase [Dasania marina]|uniref:nucleotide pyrophosphohydrolase n=1 Tax=Dasania marina TaxID=471499 RepID=UPI00037C2C28|nr:nucleotide pyrophosphohydrolase [Dasania marina]